MSKKTKRPVSALPERQLQTITEIINASIHELVFANQHLEQSSSEPGADISDELAAATDCLHAVGHNVYRLEEMLQKAADKNAELLLPNAKGAA